jgi:hypothetical protein
VGLAPAAQPGAAPKAAAAQLLLGQQVQVAKPQQRLGRAQPRQVDLHPVAQLAVVAAPERSASVPQALLRLNHSWPRQLAALPAEQ